MDAVKEFIEDQKSEFQKLRDKFKEIADSMKTELSSIKERITDLENHVNRKDQEFEELSMRLRRSEDTVKILQHQLDANEVVSRLPTLVFSGPAIERLASRQARPAGAAPRPPDPVPAAEAADQQGRTAGAGGPGPPDGSARTTAPPLQPAQEGGPAGPGPAHGSRGGRPGDFGGAASSQAERRSREQTQENALISLLNSAFPGLNLQASDIDRFHGNGKKIWCRFVRSGPGSIRDRLYRERFTLRSRDRENALFIHESLSKTRQEIFQKLLDLKRNKKLYTVFSRHGSVFFKEIQYGQNTRVDDLETLHGLRL